MLKQSSHPYYVEFSLSYALNFMKQGLGMTYMPGSSCRQLHLDGCGDTFSEGRKNEDGLCLLNCTGSYSQLSTSSTMSRNSTPTFVYQRRKQHNNSVASFTIQRPDGTRPIDGSQSAISSEAPSLAAQQNVVSVSEHAAEYEKSPNMGPLGCNTVATVSIDTDVDRVLNVRNANDNCSSSKSNLELSSASLKFDTDDAGECSSSGALIAEKEAPEGISARDICISILRKQGLLDKVWTRQNRGSTKNSGVSSDKYCSKSCKVCKRMGSTLNMLICDNCEDAFHVSCCNPQITIIPVGEWLCGSCLKKKHKILKDKSSNGNSRNRNLASEGELGSLEFMFSDTEPYMSNVRIGDEFQASVPDWSGPIDEECNLSGDPLEMDPCGYVNMQEWDSIKPIKLNLSSIGNWLQCRGIIEGTGERVDGTVCAKWRRAPLFEVQTDDWECFRCVLWDPAHADCAVPQELDTEEVMKQLKYIEMLRPRLAAKRRKTDCAKSNGSQHPQR